jgi:quinol monooxygenase YgiN
MKTTLISFSVVLLAMIFSCGKQKSVETPAVDSTAIAPEITQKIIHAKVFLKPERVAGFIEAARAMVDSSNMEQGCESYQLFQNPYDNTQFIFVEVWKDQQAIDAHFNMSYFKAWGPRTQDWMAKPTELKIFTVRADQ